MMSNVNDVSDEELAALMAELEAQNEELMAAQTESAASPSGDFDKTLDEGMAAINAATEAVVALVSKKEETEIEVAVAGGIETVPDEALPEPVRAVISESETDDGKTIEACRAKFEGTPATDKEAYVPLPDQPIPVTTQAVKNTVFDDVPVGATRTDGLKHYVDVEQFNKDTRVTEHTLDQCMIEQNGLRSHYGAQAAYAEAQHSRLKARFDVIEATLYNHHRKELVAAGEKITEKMVENAVKMDTRWLKAKNLVIEAETIATINKNLVESLKDRRDMIIQLGADRRDEYKGAARVLAEKNERSDLVNRAASAGQRAINS